MFHCKSPISSILTAVLLAATLFIPCTLRAAEPASPPQIGVAPGIDPAVAKDLLARWEKTINGNPKFRPCDKEMGEELGWQVSPYLNGFYYGYLATGDTKYIDRLVDWSDSWTRRAIQDPDGFASWPKDNGTSADEVPNTYIDNILGEAMAFRPMILLADIINKTPALKSKYGDKAKSYIDLSESEYKKWIARGCWREVKGGGGAWVVATFGIDKQTNKWTANHDKKGVEGFSLPANKQNGVALWLLAMSDVTANPIYSQHAEKWFQVMKTRMRLKDNKYYEWNYWDPNGPWDYKPDGKTMQWVGVHPNGGYYDIDLEAMVAAYEHHLVFDKTDLQRLIATNRDFMWDKKNIKGAKFQRLDGGKPDNRWKDSPGVLWSALAPYDPTLKKILEANLNPDDWGGIASVPKYLSDHRPPGQL